MKRQVGRGQHVRLGTRATLATGTTIQALRGRLRRTLLVLSLPALALGASLGTMIATSGATAAARSNAEHMVPGYVLGLAKAKLLGTAPSRRVLRIGLGIAYPDRAGETQLLHKIDDPSSPLYHHFLSVAEFQRRFGVSTATDAAVEAWLRARGLKILSSENGYVLAQGTVAQLDKRFAVTIGQYRVGKNRFLANNRPPSVPVNLPIVGVLGLDTFHQMSLASLTGKRLANVPAADAVKAGRAAIARQAAASPIPTSTAATKLVKTVGGVKIAVPGAATAAKTEQSGTQLEFTPQDVWGLEDDPGASALTNSDGTSDPATLEHSNVALGQGQVIGIFGEGETSSVVAQLRLFEQAEGLPKVPVRTIQTEGQPDSAYGDNTGAIEWYLDSQSSTGMAPDVSELKFYFAKSLYDMDISQDLNVWANDPNGPREMNASFGECEQDPANPALGPLAQYPYGTEFGDELEAVAEGLLEQSALEGRTLFTSAGDTGSGCPEVVVPALGAGNGVTWQPVPEVEYPCASDYAVCVGGTVIAANGSQYPQSAQSASMTSWTYGGGGTSYFIPAPSWQQKVSAVDSDCLSQPDGTPYSSTTVCRGTPDLGNLSGNESGDGYFIYIDGEPSSEGGTSLSSPLTMGQWARIQSSASLAQQQAGGLGFAAPVIYQQASDADTCNPGSPEGLEQTEQTDTGSSTPCSNDPVYARDFFDITQSEDVGDYTNFAGAGAITGTGTTNTGVGTGNGVYQPGPGWDYASGWGTINVANFMQDVTGSTTAPDSYGGEELPAIDVGTASMTSPAGNATDPLDVQLGNDAGLDLTGATLSATPTTVTATLTVPDLSDGPPADAAGGDDDYYVAWLYNGIVYYAYASEAQGSDSWTFASGNTKGGSYANDSSSQATGSANTTTGVITITVPASEVGSPPACSVLSVPQAFDQLGASPVNLGFTTDSSDDFVTNSQDNGWGESIAENVVVGGPAACGLQPGSFAAAEAANSPSGSGGGGTQTVTTPGQTQTVTTPGQTQTVTTPGQTQTVTTQGQTQTTEAPFKPSASCAAGGGPLVTRISRLAVSKRGLRVSGTSSAGTCAKVHSDAVALARVVGGRCSFLAHGARGYHWTSFGGCTPRDYLLARGTTRWSFSANVRLAGAYRLWEHAADTRGRVTRNTASRYVRFRVS
jgi:Pro-kumamolisin, activation domain